MNKKTQIAVYVDDEIREKLKEIKQVDPRLYQSINQIISLAVVAYHKAVCQK